MRVRKCKTHSEKQTRGTITTLVPVGAIAKDSFQQLSSFLISCCVTVVTYSYATTVCLTASFPGNNLYPGIFGVHCFSTSSAHLQQGGSQELY